MKAKFNAPFTDGGRPIRVELGAQGVTLRPLRVRKAATFFVPYEAIYHLAVRLDTMERGRKERT